MRSRTKTNKRSKERSYFIFLILILIIVIVVEFFPVLFLGKSLYFRDLYNFHYPLWKKTADLVRTGHVPFWNPGLNFGQSAAGNPNYLLFYPLAWLRFIINPLLAMNLFIFLNVLFGAIMMLLLLKKLGLSMQASFLGGLLWVSSGVVISLTVILNLVGYVFVAPLLLYSLEEIILSKAFSRLILFSIAIVFAITLFEPIIITGLIMVCLGRIIYYFMRKQDRAQNFGLVLRLLISMVIAVMISFPILLEGYRVATGSVRTDHKAHNILTYRENLEDILNFWIANPFGIDISKIHGGYSVKNNPGPTPYFLSTFLGYGAFILILFALIHEKNKGAWIAFGVAIFFLILSLGDNILSFHFIIKKIPLIGWARYSQKWIFFTEASLVIASAIGFELLYKKSNYEKKKILLIVLIILIMSAISFFVFKVNSSYSIIFLPILLILFLSCTLFKWNNSLLKILMGFTILLELFVGNSFILETTRGTLFTTKSPLLPMVKHTKLTLSSPGIYIEPVKAGTFESASSGNLISLYKLYSVALYPYIGLKDDLSYAFNPIFDRMETKSSKKLRMAFSRLSFKYKLILMKKLGVRYFISPHKYKLIGIKSLGLYEISGHDNIYLYEVKNCLPKVYFTSDFDISTNSENAVYRMLGAPLNHVSVNFLGHRIIISKKSIKNIGLDECKIIKDGASEITIKNNNRCKGVLVLRQNYSPSWKAWVDGVETPVVKADFFFCGLFLLPGSHVIQIKYLSNYLRVYLWVSVVIIFLATLFLLVRFFKK